MHRSVPVPFSFSRSPAISSRCLATIESGLVNKSQIDSAAHCLRVLPTYDPTRLKIELILPSLTSNFRLVKVFVYVDYKQCWESYLKMNELLSVM